MKKKTVILVAHLASILSAIIEPHCRRQPRQCTTAQSSYAVHVDKTLPPQHSLVGCVIISVNEVSTLFSTFCSLNNVESPSQ